MQQYLANPVDSIFPVVKDQKLLWFTNSRLQLFRTSYKFRHTHMFSKYKSALKTINNIKSMEYGYKLSLNKTYRYLTHTSHTHTF